MQDSTLENEVGERLRARGMTLAVAESCTGGLLGSRITDVPGSSDYFAGGVIAYSNRAKESVLGVPADLLARHGAVSREVALAMARGARRLLGADVALSTTGIAGPTGGTPEKPVGLVYVALAAGDREECERHVWPGDRVENKRLSAEAALSLLKRHLATTG